MAPSTLSFHPSTLMSAGSTSPRADRAILCKAPCVSERRNATTAECETSEGHAVEVSFWLVDPPGVSYFSVNCPGLPTSHFDDDMNPPWLICTEAAFVLFTVTVRGTTDHLVYTAAPAGKQSLQLIPDPNIGPGRKNPYALLPCGGEHYAVAFLDRGWVSRDVEWQFDASVFSSRTQAWRTSRASLLHLSESEKSLCGRHGLSKQVAVGGDSLGWVDLATGILLLQNMFSGQPVIRFLPFPESRVRFLDEDGLPHRPDEYYCNVSCCDDLIKFVHVEFDDPAVMISGQGWRATMWDRKISWNKWRRRSTVDVASISVDQSFSALLPVLRDNETQRLELKRLIFHTPVPSVHDDDIVYMMAKVNDQDDTAWAIAVDMEHAAVEAMAPFSVGVYDIVTMYRPCVFPKYLNMTPGFPMGASTLSSHPSTLMAAGSTSPPSGFPDGAILCGVPRISKQRNSTTAECKTSEGHTVEVSFWLVDPPRVSYFSINCPGLPTSHFADDMNLPLLICAEAAFVLFTITVRGTTDHFVYTAGPPGKQSLQLLPDHNAGPFTKNPYALLPRGGGKHYAVAFLDRSWISEDVGWRFHASVFSSETQAWKRNMVSLEHVSESDKSLCGLHGLSTQIAVRGDSLGWVDLARGILLLQNLFEGHPVIRFIHFPESRVRFMDEDGLPHRPDEYYCNVACCDDLIKFIAVEFDDPAIMTSGQGWRATTWTRKISWNKWRRRSTVDVANISVDQSYSSILPVLWDDKIHRMELKMLIFYTPILSLHNDDIFYMLAKVIDKDDTAWAITIDMERASVEAMAPFNVGLCDYLVTVYRPCVFPKYLNMTPGVGIGNPVDECFKRLSVKQCLVQVMWTIDWLRELDQCLEIEMSTYNTCRLLLQLSPVSSLRSNIESMVKCASSYSGEGEAASEAVNCCLRALDDFDLALHESPSDRSASTEAIRIQIRDVLEALDNILRIVPPTLMPKEGADGEGSRGEAQSETREKGTSKPSNNSQVEKYQENRGGWDIRLLLIIVFFLASLIFIVVPSSRKAVS